MKRLLQIIAIIAASVAMMTSCNTGKPYRTCEGIIWATTYRITYASNVALDDSVREVLTQVDQSVSTFNPQSLISAVNRGDSDVTVDAILRRVFEESQRVNRLSSGAFDPTVGPLVNLWGFGTDKSRRRDSIALVPQEEIDNARRMVGIADCKITPDGHIVKKHSGTQFNFSAIAKGYACDLVADMLKRNGCHDYMVEIGGEIVVGGQSPRQQAWRVMIDAPVPATDSVVHEGMAVIKLTDAAVATSGNYRNFHKSKDGNKGHTIDPMTGQPVESRVLSVTIVAPTCIAADAFATACMVMPMDSARAMINRIGDVSALFVTQDSTGAWELHPTRGFPPLVR